MHRVLFVEDDPNQQALIQRFLDGQGYEVRAASDGQAALRLLESESFSVLLTDLEMPEVDGIALIRRARALSVPPVIVVVTSPEETETVIQTFKTGVHDYIVKPVRRQDILEKLSSAAEEFQLKKLSTNVEQKRVEQLEERISFNAWKESVLIRHQSGADKALFSNLYQVFTQGTGFGSMISLLGMIQSSLEKAEDGRYLVDDELMDLAFRSEAIATSVLKQIADIHELYSGTLALERITLAELMDLLDRIRGEMSETLAIDRNQLIFGALKERASGMALNANPGRMEEVFRELLLNAAKFSIAGSSIYVLSSVSGGTIRFSFLNAPIASGGITGIPPEYEQRVFEPFFRLAPQVDERYDSLDHGLGLTRVGLITQQHGGSIRISSVRDFLSDGEGEHMLVNVMLSFPLF